MSIEFSGGMTDDERIISTRQLSEDETENSLRPKSMADYIGQKKAKENLSIYIQAAKMRGESLDHTPGQDHARGHHCRRNGREYPCDERSGNRKSGRFGGFIDKSLRE